MGKTHVVDAVGTSPLLPEHEDDSHCKGVKGLAILAGDFDLCNEGHLLMAHEVFDDLFQFAGDVFAFGVFGTNVCEGFASG